MELLSRKGAVLICMLVLCLVHPGHSDQATSNNATTQIPSVEGNGQKGGNSNSNTVNTPSDITNGVGNTKEGSDLSKGEWKPISERALLSNSQLYVFYQINTGFLEFIQPHVITQIQHLIDFTDMSVTSNNLADNWDDLVMYFLGFIICAGIGLVLLLIVPVTGCFIGCCRCCGKCGGGKGNRRDGPASECGRCCCGFLLFALVAFVLTGGSLMVVFSGDINARLTGDQSVFDEASNSFLKLSNYTEDSLREIRKTTLNRYHDTTDVVFDELETIIPEVKGKLNISNQLNDLNVFANNLLPLQTSATNVNTTSAEYTQLRANFTEDLEKTKLDAKPILDMCNSLACNTSEAALNDLIIDADFSLVKLDLFIKLVEKAVEMNLTGIVKEANTVFDNAFKTANKTIEDELDKAKNSSEDIEEEIKEALAKIEDVIKPEMFRNISDAIKSVKDDLVNDDVYMDIPYWVFMSISGLVLLVAFFYYIGLLYGFCGKRADLKASSCCTWKAGSCCLLTGIVFTYLFFAILILLLIIMFVVGGLSYTEICRHAYNLPNSPAKGFIDNLTHSLLEDNFNFTLSETYLACYNDESIYKAFNLADNGVNLTSILNMEKINETIDEIRDFDIDIGTVSLLPAETINQLLDGGEQLDIVNANVSIWEQETSKAVITGSLEDTANSLEDAANDTNNATEIMTIVQELRSLQAVVLKLDAIKTNLALELTSLQHYAGQNVTALVIGLQESEAMLNNSASDIAKTMVNEKATFLQKTLDNSVTGILNDIESEVGRCRPVYDVVSNMINSVCVQTLYPLNAYMFSLGMALMFLLPTILCAFKLVSLYRKTMPHAAIEESDRDLYMSYEDNLYNGAGKDSHNDVLLHRVNRNKSDYIAMADNPVYVMDDEVPNVNIPRAVIRTGTKVLPSQPAAPDDRYFYAMPTHGYRGEPEARARNSKAGRGPPPRYTASAH